MHCANESQFQQFLKAQLNCIKILPASKKNKIDMISSIIVLLKSIDPEEKNKENISTAFSESQSTITVCQNEIQELEQRILQKKSIKISLNQQIECLEEELFQIQAGVDTKRDYDQFLRRQIESKMKKVEKQKEKNRGEQSYLNKSITAVSDIFKGWLG